MNLITMSYSLVKLMERYLGWTLNDDVLHNIASGSWLWRISVELRHAMMTSPVDGVEQNG
mgnify:CR=1 FL=1